MNARIYKKICNLNLAYQKNRLKMKPYLELARTDKPIGSFLLFWPCGNLIIYYFSMEYINGFFQ